MGVMVNFNLQRFAPIPNKMLGNSPQIHSL
jgi:hypothetical protein